MFLSQDSVIAIFVVSVVFFVASVIVYMLFDDIKGVAFNKGISIGIKKGLGKPIEDIIDITDAIHDKCIRVINFIPERGNGILLAETVQNDFTGEGIIYCKLENWLISDSESLNPRSGVSYKVSITETGCVHFSSV
jgi:hypothetical protein